MNQQKQSILFGNGKSTRVGTKWSIVTVLLLAVLIVLNALMSLLPTAIANPDVTGASAFKISGKTRDFLKTLNEDVRIYLLCDGGRANADGDLYAFLKKYAEASDRISFEVIDPDSDPAFNAAHGGALPSDMSVLVESDARYRLIESTSLYYYYFYNSSYGEMTMTPKEYQELQQYFDQVDSTGQSLAMLTESTTEYFDGESRVTNAINYVTEEKVANAYQWTGNGAGELNSSLSNLLSQSCYELNTVLTLSKLPADCDLLIVNTPTVDLSQDDAAALSDYLANGGKLFLTTSYGVEKLETLNGVLQAYGLSYHENHGVLADGNPAYQLGDSSGSSPYLFYAHIQSEHAFTGDFDKEFAVYVPHAIQTTELAGGSVTPWLYTSGAGYVQTVDGTTGTTEQVGDKGEYVFGAIAELGETRIVWLASPAAISAAYNAYAANGNFELILSAFNQMTGIGNDGITISSNAIDTSTLAVSPIAFVLWSLILVILLPVTVAVTGGIIWYKRKKQ